MGAAICVLLYLAVGSLTSMWISDKMDTTFTDRLLLTLTGGIILVLGMLMGIYKIVKRLLK